MVSKSKSVLHGALWLYGAQLATILFQFAYAAITSRLVNASGFGSYAVAISASAFVGLLTNGGLSQTVIRIRDFNPNVSRALQTYASLLGLLGGLTLFFTADFWAWLWGDANAAAPIRWSSLIVLTGPSAGLASGVFQRNSAFKTLATATLISNVIGIVLGTSAAIIWRTPSSLLAAAIISQTSLTIFLSFHNKKYLLGYSKITGARGHIAFSSKVIFASMGAYFVGNIPNWSASRFFGAQYLGQWNRADTVTRIPFSQIQNALTRAVSPEFRHDIDNPERAIRVWTDLLVLIAWLVFPAVGLASAVIPLMIPILFGPGWAMASELAVPLLVIGGIQILMVILAGAVEANSWFRLVWGSQLAQGICVAIVAIVAVSTQLFWLLIFGVFLGLIAQHAVYIIGCVRRKYLDLRQVLLGYIFSSLVATVIGFSTRLIITGIPSITTSYWLFISGLFGLTLIAVIGILMRKSIPPLVLARKYGIIKS